MNKVAKILGGCFIGFFVVKLIVLGLYETLFKSADISDFIANALVTCFIILLSIMFMSDFLPNKKDKS